jgi:hypothetical protein
VRTDNLKDPTHQVSAANIYDLVVQILHFSLLLFLTLGWLCLYTPNLNSPCRPWPFPFGVRRPNCPPREGVLRLGLELGLKVIVAAAGSGGAVDSDSSSRSLEFSM